MTTGLTDLTSWTHHIGLTGVANWFDQLADLVSNNTSTGKTCLSTHLDTNQAYEYDKAEIDSIT
jgi:hypothetical protein